MHFGAANGGCLSKGIRSKADVGKPQSQAWPCTDCNCFAQLLLRVGIQKPAKPNTPIATELGTGQVWTGLRAQLEPPPCCSSARNFATLSLCSASVAAKTWPSLGTRLLATKNR